jgi:hypothetical protein
MDSLNHMHIMTTLNLDADTFFFASEMDTGWKYFFYCPQDYGFAYLRFSMATYTWPWNPPFHISSGMVSGTPLAGG